MTLGRYGEDLAARHLQHQGYAIIERNFRTKRGEIDIVARTGQTLVFCEVKSRVSGAYGHPIEAITPKKQQTIRMVAELYLAMKQGELSLRGCEAVRFDAVAIIAKGATYTIEHIENAF